MVSRRVVAKGPEKTTKAGREEEGKEAHALIHMQKRNDQRQNDEEAPQIRKTNCRSRPIASQWKQPIKNSKNKPNKPSKGIPYTQNKTNKPNKGIPNKLDKTNKSNKGIPYKLNKTDKPNKRIPNKRHKTNRPNTGIPYKLNETN